MGSSIKKFKKFYSHQTTKISKIFYILWTKLEHSIKKSKSYFFIFIYLKTGVSKIFFYFYPKQNSLKNKFTYLSGKNLAEPEHQPVFIFSHFRKIFSIFQLAFIFHLHEDFYIIRHHIGQTSKL